MLSWIEQLYEQIQLIVQLIGTNLDTLVQDIDSVQFDDSNIIYQFIGMVHYVVGDVLFVPLSTAMSIGVLLMLYRLIIIVVNIITGLIPGLKGKITIR